MFKAIRNSGFQMTFKNGITISVQFSTGSYSERRNLNAPIQSEMKMDRVESNTAEIAIWDKEGNWFDFGHDQVKGWVEADEVAFWIIFCKGESNFDDIKIRAISNGMMEKIEE